MTSETIKAGKYTFIVTENIMHFRDTIFSHTFKIGGDSYNECVSISYTYHENVPVTAKIMMVEYEPECAVGISLEKGGGTAIMLKAMLQYVHKKIPSITIFEFEDMSHIDCVEKDMTKSPPRKAVKPLSLAYLSIAYNSCTWYEKYFDAKMSDERRYNEYRNSLNFLTDSAAKVDFITFLQIAKPPQKQHSLLESIYNTSETYRDFFKGIPFADRCELLRPWLGGFIEHYIRKYYSPFNWQIDIRSPNIRNIGGIRGGRRLKNAKRRTVKSTADFPSNYRIVSYKERHMF